MDKTTTMQALEESILHWEENLQAAKERRFGDMEWGCVGCALCDQFMAEACQGCPVMLASGFSMCRETPYHQAAIQMGGYVLSNRREIPDDISDLTDAIQAEVDFLKSLRKENSPTCEWKEMESAPRDGTPILAWCEHDADPYTEDDGKTLTTYAAHAEGLGRAKDGYQLVQWGGEYFEDGYIPNWWFVYRSDYEIVANPVAWIDLPLR